MANGTSENTQSANLDPKTLKPFKTRFAPSPTGQMHFGNLRVALFNYLYAKKLKGNFLLRIEDTDIARSELHYVDAILEDLKWMALPFDEGPFNQSERKAIYDVYYQKLIEAKLLYPCFCTEEQLAITRKIQLNSGQPPRYPGTCRNLSEAEIEAKEPKVYLILYAFRFQKALSSNLKILLKASSVMRRIISETLLFVAAIKQRPLCSVMQLMML